MRWARLPVVALVVALGAITSSAEPAFAYPQWQFTSGAVRCNQCHYSPDGGGVLRGYGRDYVGEDLSTFGGNGAAFHGAVELPAWLAFSGNARVAAIAHDVDDYNGSKTAVFPMQLELGARVGLPAGLSVQAAAGLRGRVRDDSHVVPLQNYQPITASWFISREHFLMWQPQFTGPYLRVGRFFAPFGLRMAEHILYVRRDLGFNLFEESYNLSGGWLHDEWELHLTGFAPDFLRSMGGQETGVSGYVERRFLDQQASVALQGKYGDGPGYKRLVGGVVGKYYMDSLRSLAFAETNLVHLELPSVAASTQLVGALGVAMLPVRGLMSTLLLERLQRDLAYRHTTYNASTLLLSWFPYAHIELQAMGRFQFPAGQRAVQTFLFQIHYFL